MWWSLFGHGLVPLPRKILKIASHVAKSVSGSYIRQQRVGERIADAKAKNIPAPPRPAAEVAISPAGYQAASVVAARATHATRLADQLAEKFLEAEENAEDESALESVLEGLGLALEIGEKNRNSKIIDRESGDLLAEITPEARENVKTELRQVFQRIFADLI